ncbi:T9SS type A sorting domain-containing protein [Polaribacter sp.]|nr:T9SS type A sorting domain-containing protein [Polaribacter sp.]
MKKNYTITVLLTLCFGLTSLGQVFITELADPNDDATARYVEIYNGGSTSVDLTGWTLRRYTNGNADPQTTGEDLTPIGSLDSGAFAIIAANGTAFEAAFGMTADISAGTGGSADSNGDDQIYITDASDAIVDFFGVAGEDGSGTGHEFEDGRAERKASVTQGTSTWDVNEWNIDNDDGVGDGALDVNGGFDPGVWIGAATAGVKGENLVTLNTYPNPASDVLNISAQNTINTLEIFNVLGQKVINMQVENTSAEINISNLNAGIYLIKYEINNSTSTKKLVKN